MSVVQKDIPVALFYAVTARKACFTARTGTTRRPLPASASHTFKEACTVPAYLSGQRGVSVCSFLLF
jgi:hypothetical protein